MLNPFQHPIIKPGETLTKFRVTMNNNGKIKIINYNVMLNSFQHPIIKTGETLKKFRVTTNNDW